MKTSIQSFSLITVMVLLLASSAPAAETYWKAGTGNWSTGTNWDNGKPGPEDGAYIDNGGTAQVTLAGEQCIHLFLARYPGESGNVSLSGSSSLTTYISDIGVYGTGTFIHNGWDARGAQLHLR